jgi:hypothetical protein
MEPPVEEPPKPEVIDPFVQRILDSTDKVLPPQADDPEDVPLRPSVSLGEAVAARHAGINIDPAITGEPKPPAKTQAEIDAEKKAADDKAAADKAAADKAAADAKAEEARRAALPKVRKKPPEPTAPILPKAPEPPAPPPEDIDKDLVPDQLDELQIARFAESKGKKGIVEATRNFFKLVDKFSSEHPELSEKSEEFAQFIEDNRPKWDDGERRKMEREWIKAEAAQEARKTLDPILQEQNRQLLRIQSQPLIDDAMSTVQSIVVSAVEGLQSVDKSVIDLINEKGYEEALKAFPIEAPVVDGATKAAKAWTEIARGVTDVNPQDPVHAYLLQFIHEEGNNMLRQPKEAQIKNGRTFLPMHEYMAEVGKDPNQSKYWTFSNDDVVDLIGNRALLTINQQLKTLEAAGYKREGKQVSANPGTSPKVEDKITTGSPKAGGTSLPGASDTVETEVETEERKFVNSIAKRHGMALK